MLNLPKTDIGLATDGRWVEFNEKISFKIALDTNPKYKRALQSKLKAISKLREKGDYKRAEDIHNQLISAYLVTDWKGLEEDSKPLAYTQERALNIISNPEYEAIRNFIVDEAADSSAYESEVEEITKK